MTQEITHAPNQAPAPEHAAGEPTRSRPVYRPVADIYEADDGITLVLEMPGVAAEGIDVSIDKRVLTIRGRSRIERPENYRQVYAEYAEGDYERVFSLPQEIDVERIEASCRHGVLTLKLPKAAESQPRQISVRAA